MISRISDAGGLFDKRFLSINNKINNPNNLYLTKSNYVKHFGVQDGSVSHFMILFGEFSPFFVPVGFLFSQ